MSSFVLLAAAAVAHAHFTITEFDAGTAGLRNRGRYMMPAGGNTDGCSQASDPEWVVNIRPGTIPMTVNVNVAQDGGDLVVRLDGSVRVAESVRAPTEGDYDLSVVIPEDTAPGVHYLEVMFDTEPAYYQCVDVHVQAMPVEAGSDDDAGTSVASAVLPTFALAGLVFAL